MNKSFKDEYLDPSHFLLSQGHIFFHIVSTEKSLEQSVNHKFWHLKYIINYPNQPKMSLPFALVVPGQPVITNFEYTNGIYHTDLQNPKKVANLCLFLTERIPDNYAITLYFSLPPYNQMQYIGAIANQKPSDHFSTGFPFQAELDHCYSVKLCIQAQTFEEIIGLVRCTDGQKEYAKLVAHNLYNFMMSYNTECIVANNYNGKEYFAVPTDAFTKWLKKFDQKYEKDPNFILKTSVQ